MDEKPMALSRKIGDQIVLVSLNVSFWNNSESLHTEPARLLCYSVWINCKSSFYLHNCSVILIRESCVYLAGLVVRGTKCKILSRGLHWTHTNGMEMEWVHALAFWSLPWIHPTCPCFTREGYNNLIHELHIFCIQLMVLTMKYITKPQAELSP